MKQPSLLDTFKFDANIKQPFVLRPTNTPWIHRFPLLLLKAIANIPTRFFRSYLSVDCNERIIEIPYVLQNLISPSDKSILDFGCAESVLSIYLATRGAKVIGVDLRDYEFEHPNFTFIKGDFLDNRFPNAFFDAVVAVSAVEHCGLNVYGSSIYNDGDKKVIMEFKRVLKPKGILLLTVPFGVRYTNETLRIYDSQELLELTQGFSLLNQVFYIKSPEGTYWRKCSQKEAASAGYQAVTGVQGVAMLSCEKPL